jgi:hypothetical protein
MRGKGLSYICYSFEINQSFFLGRFLGNKAFQNRATLAVKGPFFVPAIMIMFLKEQSWGL